MNKTLYILVATGGAYDDYWQSVQGVTESKEVASAFMEINKFSGVHHELVIVTQEVMDGKLTACVQEWLNPKKNPLCTCGHRLLHHRNWQQPSRLWLRTRSDRAGHLGVIPNGGSCKHNVRAKSQGNYHACKKFVFAIEQPEIGEFRKHHEGE